MTDGKLLMADPNFFPQPIGDPVEALNCLNEIGYVVLDTDLAKQCDDVVAEFSALEKIHSEILKREPDGRYPRLINFHLAIPKMLHIFSQNHLALAVQDAFFNAKSSLYTSLFYERGSAQDLHRDTPYFTTRPEHKYLGVWTALEDVDESNGPLMVMPYGHLLPEEDREAIAAFVFPDGKIPDASDELWVAYQTAVANRGMQSGLIVQSVPIRKGQTIIWHPQLPHGGAPILDVSRTRLSLV